MLPRIAQAAHNASQIASQQHLYLILPILSKRINGRPTSPRPQWHPRQMLFLRQIGPKPNRVTLQRTLRAPHRQPANPLRRRNIPVQQGRRQIPDVDIVKPKPTLISGQHRGSINIQCQQIPNGILIFGPIQPPKRLRPPWIHARRIQRSLKRRQQCHPFASRRLWHPRRRHHARPHLPNHLLPKFSPRLDPRQRRCIQPQPATLHPLVMAGQTVPIQELPLLRSAISPGREAKSQRRPSPQSYPIR